MTRLVLIIDPQNAFCSPTGSLARAFGPEELLHIRDRLNFLELFLMRQTPEEVVYVRSEYKPGQFTSGQLGHPFSQACVPTNGQDCDWGLPAHVIRRSEIITKKEESAASASELIESLSQRAKDGLRQVLLGGFLTTSCVRKTAIDLRAALPLSVDIGVAESLTASRLSNYTGQAGSPSRHEQALHEMAQAGISIIKGRL